MHFFNENLDSNFIKACSSGSNWSEVFTGASNGLMPYMRQAFLHAPVMTKLTDT